MGKKGVFMKCFLISLTCIGLLTGCSFNVSMAHTDGVANDTIDDTASNTPNISPNITIPLTPGSAIQVSK